MYAARSFLIRKSVLLTPCDSYFVTELLGTDLHRLLTSRPLEKQFIQYFLYQILVRDRDNLPPPGFLVRR